MIKSFQLKIQGSKPNHPPTHQIFQGVTKSVQAKKLALASAQAQEPYELRRMRLEVASLVVDPKRPRVAAGGMNKVEGKRMWSP